MVDLSALVALLGLSYGKKFHAETIHNFTMIYRKNHAKYFADKDRNTQFLVMNDL